jgi:hypothetical protein
MTCEDVSKDTPRLAHEETDPICVAEFVDLEARLHWSVCKHNHLELLEHLLVEQSQVQDSALLV